MLMLRCNVYNVRHGSLVCKHANLHYIAQYSTAEAGGNINSFVVVHHTPKYWINGNSDQMMVLDEMWKNTEVITINPEGDMNV